MFTKISSTAELKALFTEILLDKTSKVTKISDNSVLNGIAFGIAKVSQKAIKDIALVESHLFPDVAFGEHLDNIADNNGIAPRFGSSGSSTYVRLVGAVGTQYLINTHTFSGSHGISFDLESNITIGDAGFTYVKVRSQDVGLKTNVDPLSINTISPIPTGHTFVINEYEASGGRDVEQDDTFRRRIKEGSNILAKGTLAMLEQVFMKINNNVLRIFYHGFNSQGQIIIAILTQNGIDLTTAELDEILNKGSEFFSLSELKPLGSQSYGISLQNVQYQPLDLSFRVELFPSFNPDDIRKNIQARISKALDFRFWEAGTKIQWVDLLQIVKTTDGVRYIPDTYFFPNADIVVDRNQLPRVRGFLMLDLNGNVISNLSGTLSPLYYSNVADFSFAATVLKSL